MQRFFELSDRPAAARHPSNGGELGAVLYFFYCVLLMCRSGTAYPTLCVSSYLFKLRCRLFSHTRIHREGASRPWRSSVLRYVRAYARGIIYWIATPSAMARNDKKSVCGGQRTRGQNGNAFLYSLTAPPLRGTPP